MNMTTVLIIEDNEMNMEIASLLLVNNHFNVLKAIDGETGLQLARSHQPQIILMDMHLPNKDGFELTQMLKNDNITKHIKIVAFTALVMEDDKKRALNSGCVGIISKPIEVETFATTVASFL